MPTCADGPARRACAAPFRMCDVPYIDGRAAISYVMRVSSNGQVSIPPDARSRWQSQRVVVVDLGDRVVIRPLPADPIEPLVGKYRGRGPTTDQARRAARRDDARRDRRKQR